MKIVSFVDEDFLESTADKTSSNSLLDRIVHLEEENAALKEELVQLKKNEMMLH